MPSPQGRLLAGRYGILSEIGSGGMGTVYRARDAHTGRLVAIKVLHPHLAREPAYLERFRREANIALALDSRHIVQVLDFGHEGESQFLVMEYVAGASLRRLLQSRRTLPLQDALRIAVQVARALEEAHSKGVVHRDIKPENILILGDGTVKVADFGIARAQDYSTLTVTGSFIGTVQYMAPEVFTGSADFRSDIYSLGIVLYQMLAGAPPFDAPTPWEVMRQHREDVPPPLEERVPGVAETVEGLVRRCLAKEPDERFQSAFEVRRELEALLPGIGEPGGQVAIALSMAASPGPWARLARVPFRTSAAAVSSMRTASRAGWRQLSRAVFFGIKHLATAVAYVHRALQVATNRLGRLPWRRGWRIQRWALPAAGVVAALAVGGLSLYFAFLRGASNGQHGGVQVVPLGSPMSMPTSEATAPPVTLQDFRTVVPWGWSVDNWLVTRDGAYVVLTTTGPTRGHWGPAREVNVYYRGENGLVEVARWSALWDVSVPTSRAPLDIMGAGGVLEPDESGTRLLSVEFYDPANASASERRDFLTIDSAGNINMTVGRKATTLTIPAAAEGTRVADPSSPIAVTPSSLFGGITPEPSLTVPSGTLPPGWIVSQAVWSTDHEYLAIVTQDPNAWDASISQLSIHSLAQGRLRELWRDVSAYVTINEDLTFTDINGDGAVEVVYSTGGTSNSWADSGVLAATLTESGEAEDLLFRLPIEASAPVTPLDLDGNGVYEWEVLDASWELVCFGHAGSPASIFVLAWDGHEYVDATARYPKAVDDNRLGWNRLQGREQLDPVPPPAGASGDEKNGYLSESVGRYLDYWNSGRTTEADGILSGLRTYEFFGELSAKRDWIVAALERDPHDTEGSARRLGECPLQFYPWA
jgi:predicted Ser/Thr protein kinase